MSLSNESLSEQTLAMLKSDKLKALHHDIYPDEVIQVFQDEVKNRERRISNFLKISFGVFVVIGIPCFAYALYLLSGDDGSARGILGRNPEAAYFMAPLALSMLSITIMGMWIALSGTRRQFYEMHTFENTQILHQVINDLAVGKVYQANQLALAYAQGICVERNMKKALFVYSIMSEAGDRDSHQKASLLRQDLGLISPTGYAFTNGEMIVLLEDT
ncbi:hypothetical protein [Neptuniibacter sp. QD37_11]|uniref:hypothetical protein n=1 Tax=Neptuniibacter sp. QD37_11 TaxID=3398209 RepID=UPI0039F4DF71